MFGSLNFQSWLAHIWCWPTPDTSMVSSGVCSRSISMQYCGFSGPPSSCVYLSGNCSCHVPNVARHSERSGAPCFSCSDLHRLDELVDDDLAVTDDRHVGPADLAELGGVDVDVDDLRVHRERRRVAGDAVVEARTERHEQVRLLHRGDRGVVAVHARHAEAERVLVRQRAPAHQRRDDRDAGELGELAQLLRRARVEDAAAGVDDGLPRVGDQPRRFLDLPRVALHVRLVAGQVDLLGPVPLHRRVRRCPSGSRRAPGRADRWSRRGTPRG